MTCSRVFWIYVNKEQSISGEWAYRINNEITLQSRYGVFYIQQNLNGVRIRNGNVWFCGKPPTPINLRGTWFSTASSVVGNEFHFIFDMKTLVRKENAGIGERVIGTIILDLQREKGRPVELYGKFFDHLERAGNRGSFIAQRITGKTRRERREEAFILFGSDEENKAEV